MAIWIIENLKTKEIKIEKGWLNEEKAWVRAFGWKYKNIKINLINEKRKLYEVINKDNNNKIGIIKKVKE